MARWNARRTVERPEFPKLVPIGPAGEQAPGLLPILLRSDPMAEMVQGGAYGLYVRIHNAAAESAAKMYVLGESPSPA